MSFAMWLLSGVLLMVPPWVAWLVASPMSAPLGALMSLVPASGPPGLLRVVGHPDAGACSNLQSNGCRWIDRRGGGPPVSRTRRRYAPRHPAPLHPSAAVGVATRRRLPDELRRGAEARRGAGAGRPGDQGASRTGAARAHRWRRRGPGTTDPRRARGGLARTRGPDGRSARAGAQRMTVVSVEKDFDSLSLILVAQFDAPIERVWQLWADPRQLERWWGPPTHPATVEQHELAVGGEVSYFMTGPGGETTRGWWRVTSVEPPTALEFTDGFANPDGTPNERTPTTAVRMRLAEHDGGTRMELRFRFESAEQMERLE